MASNVRFTLFNSDEAFGALLRSMLLKEHGVRIAAEVDHIGVLPTTIERVPSEVLFVNLDPNPELVLPLCGQIASEHPHLIIFATSELRDGQLILEVMRKGIREFFPKPIDVAVLYEAIEKVVRQRVDTAPHGRLITVLSGCGGQGATMLATNLAVELADLTQGKVAVVDLDYRFGQVATFLDLEPAYTLGELCSSLEQLDVGVIEKALERHESGVQVLGRPRELAQSEGLTAASCVGVLSTLVQMKDYVVVDGPSRFDINARAVLDLADLNLLIVQCLVPSVRNSVRIIRGMREAGYNMDRTSLVCNRVGKESSHLSLNDVTATIDMEPIVRIPDDWTTVGGAVNLGAPLITYSPKSRVRQAVRELAEKIAAGSPEEKTEAKDGKKGLMSRIFN